MGKSILVLDTPECCDYCPVGRIFGMDGQVECRASRGNGISVNPDGRTIPDWCPLQHVPMERMSNDLISRSTLMQSLRGNVLVDVTPNLEQAIEEQPTAYDVDKAVEQLKVAFERTVAEILDRTDSEFTIADFNIGKYTERLEETVRTGGIE